MRVLNINAWAGLNYQGIVNAGRCEPAGNRAARYRVLTSQAAELDPDILVVQEANKLPAFARRLGRDLDMDWVARVGLSGIGLDPVILPMNLRQGDAILARRGLRLRYIGRRRLSGGYCGRWFSFNWVDASQIICGRIDGHPDIPGPVFVFATHWRSSPYLNYLNAIDRFADTFSATPEQIAYAVREIREGADERMRQARNSLDFIDQVAGSDPCLLVGDFNAGPDKPEVAYLRDNGGFKDSYDAAPHHGEKCLSWNPQANTNQANYYGGQYIPCRRSSKKYLYFRMFEDFNRQARRIDYILFRGRVQADSHQLAMNRALNGIHTSDHFGVVADLVFRNDNRSGPLDQLC